MEEPTAILREYAKSFLSGSDTEEDREKTRIYAGRSNIWENALDEIVLAGNLRNIIEVTFYGELCEDLGGPRLEFFRIFLKEAEENLLDDDRHLKYNSALVVSKAFYSTALLIGLSAIQGGPCAPFLAELIENLQQGEEHHIQFQNGLERVGIFQLIKTKPTVAYLFRSRTSKLLVNRRLHVFQPQFAEIGTNKRMKDASYSMFIRYVRQVAAGRREGITLGSILQFGTGADEEPPLGFVRMPSMHFADLAGSLPTHQLAQWSCIYQQIFNHPRINSKNST